MRRAGAAISKMCFQAQHQHITSGSHRRDTSAPENSPRRHSRASDSKCPPRWPKSRWRAPPKWRHGVPPAPAVFRPMFAATRSLSSASYACGSCIVETSGRRENSSAESRRSRGPLPYDSRGRPRGRWRLWRQRLSDPARGPFTFTKTRADRFHGLCVYHRTRQVSPAYRSGRPLLA